MKKPISPPDIIDAIHNARKIYAEQYPFEVRGV
jgi:hypothetical protein